MKEFAKQHKVLIIVIGILVLLSIQILIPMSIRGVWPFEICEYDPAKVIAIELTHGADTVRIEDREQIRELIEELNEKRYFFWTSDMSIASYLCTAYL